MIRRLFWLLFAFSLAGVAASSLALFAGPSREVALWSSWTFLSLSRPRWESLHLGLGALLALSGLMILLLGGRRMMAAAEGEADSAPAWITAILVFVVLGAASVLMLPPGGSLVSLSDSLKSWHAKSFGEPPVAGAADLSPTELAKRLSMDPGKALTNLALHNVKLSSPDATIAEIAKANGLAPAAVYETLRGGREPRLPAPQQQAEAPRPQAQPLPPQLPADPPPGLGRLKLADVCEQYGLSLNKAVETLAKSGVKATGDLTLRQIAQNNLMLPIEIYDALRGTPQRPYEPQVQAKPGEPAPTAPPALQPAPAVQDAPAPSGQAPTPGQPQELAPVVTPGPAPAQAPAQTPAQGTAPQAAPEGIEHMSLAAFCRERGLDTGQALARLRSKGIVAFSDMTFRELSVENNLTPEQVMQLMLN